MSNVAKKEKHDQETAIFNLRHEPGVQMLRAWLFRERDEINAKWSGMTGEDLIRLQGEARRIAQLIKVIDNAPAFKQQEA